VFATFCRDFRNVDIADLSDEVAELKSALHRLKSEVRLSLSLFTSADSIKTLSHLRSLRGYLAFEFARISHQQYRITFSQTICNNIRL